MLMGLCGTIFSITLFGFSQNFAWAVCARLIWGLLNGNIGVVKTYMSEVNCVCCTCIAGLVVMPEVLTNLEKCCVHCSFEEYMSKCVRHNDDTVKFKV